MAPLRVAVVYRVIQAWRVPVFSRLSKRHGIQLCVFHGDDFEGTKVASYKGGVDFATDHVPSLQFRSRTSNGSAYVPFSPGLWSSLKAFDPDVIICEGASNGLNNIVSWLYAKRFGKRIVQWGLGSIEGRRRSLQRRLLDIVFRPIERTSDGAIAYSSFGKQYYQAVGLPDDRIFVAVNVVDTDRRLDQILAYCQTKQLPLPSPVPSSFNVLFVGSLSENKGVDKLIRAFAGFLASHDDADARLTLIGGGPDRRRLEAIAADLGIADRVAMPGEVTDGISAYFYDASVFVLPGLGGLAVSDALVHGVPVICTIGDGCEKDLIENGVNGEMIPDLSQDRLTAILGELYRNPQTLARMRAGAQRFASGPHNISQYVATIHRAIQVCAHA